MLSETTPRPFCWIFGALAVVLLIRLGLERRNLTFNPLGRWIARLTDPLIRPLERLGLGPQPGWEPAAAAGLVLLVPVQGLLLAPLYGTGLAVAMVWSGLGILHILFQTLLTAAVLAALHGPRTLEPIVVLCRRLAAPWVRPFGFLGMGWLATSGGVLILLALRTAVGAMAALVLGTTAPEVLLRQQGLLSLILAVQTYRLFELLLLAAILASWFPGAAYGALGVIQVLVEPILAPFRRLIPPIGGIDLSPIVLFLLLQVVFGRLSGALWRLLLGG